MPFTFKLSKRLALMKASAVALTAAAAVACEPGDQPPTGPTEPNLATTSSVNPGTPSDLRVTAASDTSVTLAFTEVDDGTGQPAQYEIRYAPGVISWGAAASATRGTCATPVAGSAIGATRRCTVSGLASSMNYQFQLVAFGGTLNVNAVFGSTSNVTTATTTALGQPGTVLNLAVASATDTSVMLAFTELQDGTDQPASYDVRYALAPIGWGSATGVARGSCATPVVGTAVGALLTCTVLGLTPATAYDFQLVAFRGTLNVNAVFGSTSNVTTATTAVPDPVPVASVPVSPAPASVAIGQTVQLMATPKDATGNPLSGRVVTWASSNPAVATVSASGLVTGVAAGAATISATSEGATGSSAVTVSVSKPGTATDLAVAGVTDSSVTLAFTEVNDGTGQPASYDVRSAMGAISWSSAPSVSRGTCATPVAGSAIGVKRSCTVLGLAPATGYQFQLVTFRGTLNVNAVFGALSNVAGGTTAAPAVVPVVAVSPASASVAVGQTAQLTATSRDAAGNPLSARVVTWATSNAAVATVTGSGLVTGVTAGAATISATSEGQSGAAGITVTAPVSTNSGTVTDLAVAGVTDNSVTLSFTEVTDGTGQPASYDIRWAVGVISWGAAAAVTQGSCATPVGGGAIGATRTCTVLGLAPPTGYQFQLVTFRGTLNVNAVFGGLSNVARTTTAVDPAPPPPPGGTWPNQPAGFTTIVDAPFNALVANGWQCVCDPTLSIASDATALLSPASVLQFSYPIGFPGGIGPGNEYYDFASNGQPWPTELYIGFWWKPSNPWQGHSSNVNKLMFISTGGTQDAVLFEMQGVGSGPFDTKVVTEFPGGVGTYKDNQPGSPWITLGQWHRIEIHLRYSDGLMEWWMDGLLRGRYTGLSYPHSGFDGFKFAPTWGGTGDVKTENDFFWFDHLHASRP